MDTSSEFGAWGSCDKQATEGKQAFIPDGTRAAYESSDWGQLGLVFADNADADLTLHIATPGTLMREIRAAGYTPKNVVKLTLTGTLNDDDWAVIQNMKTLYLLDLSGIENTTMPSLSSVERLIEFTFPQKLVSIPYEVFGSNFSGTLTIPESVTEIGNNAFYYCSGLTGTLTIPDGVTSIGSSAFYGCSGLTGTLTIGESVTSIDYSAFRGCSGFSGALTIPDGVTNIGYEAFYGCSGLTGTLTIGESVTKIGYSAFYGCSGLTGTLTIGESVTKIGYSAFYGCSGFTGEVVLPNSVTSVGSGCFAETGINAIVFGKNITTIPSDIVKGCTIDSITCYAMKPPKVDANFESVNTDKCKLKVPAGTKALYEVDPVWGNFINIVEVDVPADMYLVKASAVNGRIVSTETGKTLIVATVEKDSVLALRAVPENGYRLASLKIDGVEYIDNVAEDGSFSTPAVTEAMNIEAVFEVRPVYTLTVEINDSEMGAVAVSGGEKDDSGKYFEGSAVTLTAQANSNYEFVQWEDGTTDPTRVVKIESDLTVKATFKLQPKPQTITWNQAVTEFQEGETIELTAEASSDLAVEYTVISGNATISGSKLTATAPGEITVEATQSGNDEYLAATTVRKTFTAIAKITPKPQTITWNQDVTEFQEGETIELTAEASSGLAVEYTVISGNATVSGSKLTATAPGEITVEAAQPGNDEYLAATTVRKTFTAIAKITPKPQTITWNQAVTEFQEGETIDLTAEASSGLAVEYTVISGNATIDGSKLTATAPGEITVEAAQPGNDEYLPAETITKEFTITAKLILVSSITLNKEVLSLEIGEEETLEATVMPENAADRTVQWASSDRSIASVDDNGKVTAVCVGSTTITASCGSVSATCKITVSYSEPTDIVVAEGSDLGDIFTDGIELFVGESLKIDLSVVPSTANQTITFISSDEDVASIDENGYITAVAEGKCKFILLCDALRKTFVVEVERRPQTIVWEQEFEDVREDDVVELTASASSGLDVEYDVIVGDASVVDSRLTVHSLGLIAIEASQPGNDEYLPAESVRKTFNITTDIDHVFSEESKVNITGNELTIGEGEYALYDLQGRCIKQGVAPVSIVLYRNTPYILRIGDRSVKFILR